MRRGNYVVSFVDARGGSRYGAFLRAREFDGGRVVMHLNEDRVERGKDEALSDAVGMM